MKQFPYAPIKILKLLQGVAEVFFIDFNDDLSMGLEGNSHGRLCEHFLLTSIRGLIKKCTRNRPKELQEHHPLIFNHDIIRNLTGICPGSIWSMPITF